MTLPALTPNHALFLDIDGTLIDLAATPDSVTVPPNLPSLLRQVQQKLGGALAILSGRKLTDILSPPQPGLPCAPEHGTLLRNADGQITRTGQPPAAYEHWLKIFN